jgi:hypothetical protein
LAKCYEEYWRDFLLSQFWHSHNERVAKAMPKDKIWSFISVNKGSISYNHLINRYLIGKLSSIRLKLRNLQWGKNQLSLSKKYSAKTKISNLFLIST